MPEWDFCCMFSRGVLRCEVQNKLLVGGQALGALGGMIESHLMQDT